MQLKHRSLLIKCLIAIGIDVALFFVFIICWWPAPDESTIELLLLMAIFVINIGLAVAFKYAIKSWYLTLVLNSIISVFIFHVLLTGWYTFQDRGIRKMQFVTDEKNYELVLDRKDTSYSFYKNYKNGSSSRFMSGQYKISNDTVYLTDPVNQMIVYKDTLVGFTSDKIALKDE